MSDYHSIALNFVILVSYMQMKAQKMCECQDISFNKDALIFFSSSYINWILIAIFAQHICENLHNTFAKTVFQQSLTNQFVYCQINVFIIAVFILQKFHIQIKINKTWKFVFVSNFAIMFVMLIQTYWNLFTLKHQKFYNNFHI